MKGSCACFDCRSAALALARWGLGILFLVGGISKLFHLSGFVNTYLVPTFANTFLPAGLVTAYGYTLPFVETLLGISLVLGLCRNGALFIAGLTFISLAFGQILLQKFDVVAQILFYLLMTGSVLFLGDYDRWIVGCCGKSSEAQE